MRITDLPELSTENLAMDDVVVVDHNTGNGIETRRMTVSDLLEGLNASCLFGLTDTEMISAIKNSRPHGICLGDTLIAAQAVAIAAGTFEGICLGDYWLKDGIHWRVCGFNYWYKTGSPACMTPHVVIMPDEALYQTTMEATNTTENGYANSAMRKTGLAQAKSIITAMFGAEHLLTHQEYLISAAEDGEATKYDKFDCGVELPSETMMYGGYIFSPANSMRSHVNRYTTSKTQLPLYGVCPSLITVINGAFWLRDLTSSGNFAYVDSEGTASDRPAGVGYDCGVRPVFGLM